MTPEAYLDRVRTLLPVLRERAPYAEKLRRLPDETFNDFQEALRPEFADYQRNVIINAQTLAKSLSEEGFRVVTANVAASD